MFLSSAAAADKKEKRLPHLRWSLFCALGSNKEKNDQSILQFLALCDIILGVYDIRAYADGGSRKTTDTESLYVNMDHSQHRQRIIARFERGEYLEDHELLEVLLFFSRPRVNTNGIAHELIDSCGSLHNVLYSTGHRLEEIDGVGKSSSTLLRLVGEIMHRCNLSGCDTSKIYGDEDERKRYLCALFDGANEEKVYMLMFGRTNRFLGCELIGEGIIGEGEINSVKATQKAREEGAAAVIIAHNHPDGLSVASSADLLAARRMDILFSNSDVDIIGHYVVAGNKCERYADNRSRKNK